MLGKKCPKFKILETPNLWLRVAKTYTNKISVALKTILFDPHISQIEEKSLEKRPKFLDLYASINFIKNIKKKLKLHVTTDGNVTLLYKTHSNTDSYVN